MVEGIPTGFIDIETGQKIFPQDEEAYIRRQREVIEKKLARQRKTAVGHTVPIQPTIAVPLATTRQRA